MREQRLDAGLQGGRTGGKVPITIDAAQQSHDLRVVGRLEIDLPAQQCAQGLAAQWVLANQLFEPGFVANPDVHRHALAVGQCLQQAVKKRGRAAEFFSILIKRLIGAVLAEHQYFAQVGVSAAKAVDQAPVRAVVAYFQAQLSAPAWQVFQ